MTQTKNKTNKTTPSIETEAHKVYVPHRDKTIRLSKRLAQTLAYSIDGIKHSNQDSVVFIDGPEGAGKSVAARQIAYWIANYLDTEFGVGNIHNDINSYINHSLSAGPGTVEVLDEGRKILNRKRSMGKEAVRFTNYLSECRHRNQVHIICAPSFQDVDAYVAKWRMKFLIHLDKEWERVDDPDYLSGERPVLGKYYVYDNNRFLRDKYDAGNYAYPKKWYARDRFSYIEPLTDEELQAYESQKEKKMREKYGTNSFASKTDQVVGACLTYVKDEQLMAKACRNAEDWLGIPVTTFRYHVNKWLKERFDADSTTNKKPSYND